MVFEPGFHVQPKLAVWCSTHDRTVHQTANVVKGYYNLLTSGRKGGILPVT